MADLVRDKREKQEKKVDKMPADGTRDKEKAGGTEDPMITDYGLDEQGNHEDLHAAEMDPTHPLGPSKPFPVTDVLKILKEEIDNKLQGEKYEAQRSRELTLTLCEVIKNRVKQLQIPRYRIVVKVHIGQIIGQGIQTRSGFLWDPSTDTFASHSFKNDSLFCCATVFAVYFE
ncbi:PREDICTED: tctex1 domain-containing protein 1-B-like [Cyprinodon variegatus]|uniref:tctex1 domain-containing protein 1-B-like n=1 Tax=Cyprinodon variegatus TaxID=28743 RepID=UPI0007428AB8|nr:PREDICTED: tctex1 domain-containing protein 1-B-like [Cyprinodon variegatus]